MTYTSNVNQLQKVNSTTYADLLGLQLGLDRLQGETSEAYVRRLSFASNLRREHPYEGALNEISLQLGVEPSLYIHSNIGPSQIISVSIAGVVIDSNPPIPILTFDNDTMWKWRMLSDVVTDMNAIVASTLLVDDGPAFQLARQSNSLWSFSEPVDGIITQLAHAGIVVGSESFNQNVSSYTLTPEGLLTFAIEPDSGTEITYNYIVSPYDLVGSPVALIGFKDPEFASVAADSNSALSYQVREFIQSLMLVDRSYWAK